MNSKNKLLCDLTSLEYGLQAVTARINGVAKRIRGDWLLKTPLKTYGNPPKILSEILTAELLGKMLDGLVLDIKFCYEKACLLIIFREE